MSDDGVLLVIDDSEDYLDMVGMAFGQLGRAATLTTVDDVGRAITLLASTDPVPRLVLLDLHLAGRSGLDVLRALRADARTRHVPVVMLTSDDGEDSIRAADAHGASAYLRKPATFAGLRDVLRSTLDFWLDANLPPEGAGR